MEELFEKRRKRKEEPCVKLFLAKKNDVGRPLLNRRRSTIHQVYGDSIQDVEILPKLRFRNEFSRVFQTGTIDTCSYPNIFLAHQPHWQKQCPSLLTYQSSGARETCTVQCRMLENNHPTPLPTSSAPNMQQMAAADFKSIPRRDTQSCLPGKPQLWTSPPRHCNNHKLKSLSIVLKGPTKKEKRKNPSSIKHCQSCRRQRLPLQGEH